MKLTVSVLAAGLLGVLLCGCNGENQKPAVDSNELKEVQVVDLYRDLAIQNAIITQRTIYPYHFVNNSVNLNALGQRDLAVLANHFVENPGELSVRQGDTPKELYQQRVETVMSRLAESGVDRSRLRVNHDHMPGGDGMTTTEIIGVLERSREPLSNTNVSDYGTSFGTQP